MNKKQMRFALVALACLSSVAFAACTSDDDTESSSDSGYDSSALKINYVTLSRTTAYGDDWIYYSLSEGKEVDVDEETHYDDLSWDLAFNRYNVRTNSGLSGAGQGGALDTELTDMSAVTTVPSGTFVTDSIGEITASFTGSGITTIESTLNSVLASAIAFSGPPPTYTPNNHVYVVRTADGKYAKLRIESFYDDEGNSGYVQFKYFYQPDGSTDLTSK